MKEKIVRSNEMDIQESVEQAMNIRPGLINTIFEKLVLEKELKRMPESVYAGYFLPRILGAVEDEENLWVSYWINIAGSPQLGVVVYDDKTNEDLFTAPAILGTPMIPEIEDAPSYYEMINEGQRRLRYIPTLGREFFKQELTIRGHIISRLVDPEYEGFEDWIYILKRYNVIPSDDEQTEETTEASTESGKTEEEDIESLFIF